MKQKPVHGEGENIGKSYICKGLIPTICKKTPTIQQIKPQLKNGQRNWEKKGTEQMVNPVMCILPQFKKTVSIKINTQKPQLK